MRVQKSIFLTLLLCLAIPELWSQSLEPLATFNLERESLNQQGMLILGSWSVANMTWSAFNLNHSNDLNRAYHQMNLGWNAVNLAIAGFGYYQSLNPESLNLATSIDAQEGIKRILAVNAGLDLAYIASGFYLRERAKNRPEEFDRWEGFGRAVIVNGAFLFAFDLILYWVHQSHGAEALSPIIQGLQLGPNGLGLQIKF